MNREIKFRAWDKTKERMYFNPMLSELPINMYFKESSKEEMGWIWMQYTGLKDKNGKEIYEGDLLSRTGYVVGEVKFEKGMFLCENFGYSGNWKDCEVIGNIYENKLK